jgi:hypothetical protein
MPSSSRRTASACVTELLDAAGRAAAQPGRPAGGGAGSQCPPWRGHQRQHDDQRERHPEQQQRQWSEVTAPKAWVRTVGSRIAFRLVAEGPRSVKAALAGCWGALDAPMVARRGRRRPANPAGRQPKLTLRP